MKRRMYRHAVVQPLDPSIKLIPLTKDQTAIVDATDYEWLNQWNWTVVWSGGAQSFYAVRNYKGRVLQMHREIIGYDSPRVDHRNRNTLDNRRENLRPCSHSQNQANRKTKKETQSGFKGVRNPVGKRKRWRATIRIQGKDIHLGYFETPESAALAYDCAALKHFGEFAHLNLPISAPV